MAASLDTYDETDPEAVINSPRSLQACKQEGVLPQDLVYKPVETFQEKDLSPRLVQLRHDFFEAKRMDLLSAARRARGKILAGEKEKEDGNSQLDVFSTQYAVSEGDLLALNNEGLKQERQKLLRAQESLRSWLRHTLNNELNQIKLMESSDQALAEEARAHVDKQQEKARFMKELNDKRLQEEEHRAVMVEAQQRRDKQVAKEVFLKQQQELKRKAEVEVQKEKEAYARQLRDMEKKKQAEIEKQERKEALFREQEERRAQMRSQDLKRQEVVEQQKQAVQMALFEKKEQRDQRLSQSVLANIELDQKRRDEFEEKQRQGQVREERLSHARALEQERSAKASLQSMMKHKLIREEAARKQHERRLAILEQQERTDMRLLEHEQKKERYLGFRRELDGLRAKNKEINVERQRRREEAAREAAAARVRKKEARLGVLSQERARLQEMRRQVQSEAFRAREMMKDEIMQQRVTSKYDSKVLESKLNSLMQQFGPDMLQTSTSMPLLSSSLSEVSQASAEPL